MITFTIGVILIMMAFFVPMIVSAILEAECPAPVKVAARVGLPIIGVIMILISSAIFVDEDKSGVVVVKFGTDLPVGKIIATNGEKGPQARILPPGWHFFYWPWNYELRAVPTITVPAGHVGVVEARDGANPLAKGEIFAAEWEDPQEMLDGVKFMQRGQRGPQLTVLTPAQYRYNPTIFNITIKKALEVPIGKVAVIKANAGLDPSELENKASVNGIDLVPRGYRGIWNTALHPDAYYLHPDAYIVTLVQTTNRIYEYVDPKVKSPTNADKSIGVKTIDGFIFPVDVRVSAKISAEDAPFVVAMLANPDADSNKDGFNTLEDIVILPLIRAIFRNNAEDKKALEYVQNRSQIEKDATAKFTAGLTPFKVTSDGVFIGENGLTDTAEGKSLMSTQTDKEVALQEKATFQEQKLAQEERAKMVKAQEDADQEKNKAIARAGVEISEQDALSKINLAKGEAAAFEEKVKALGGVENFVKLEMLKLGMDKWEGRVPNILMMGAGGKGVDSTEAVNALLLRLMQEGAKITPTPVTK
jgi:hypothetical protein